MQISSAGKRKKILGIVLGLIFLAALAGAVIFLQNNNTSRKDGAIDYSPATKEDKEFNDSLKADLEDSKKEGGANRHSAGEEGSVREVTPIITAYGQPKGPGTDFVLNGFVPGIVENNGTCMLTVTKNGKEVSASKPALQNAQDTSCGQLSIPFTELGSTGTWSATLSYDSPSASGSSKATQVEIK